MIRFRDSSLNIQYLFFGQEQKYIVFNDMKYYFRMRMSERVRLESLFILKKARYKFLILLLLYYYYCIIIITIWDLSFFFYSLLAFKKTLFLILYIYFQEIEKLPPCACTGITKGKTGFHIWF